MLANEPVVEHLKSSPSSEMHSLSVCWVRKRNRPDCNSPSFCTPSPPHPKNRLFFWAWTRATQHTAPLLDAYWAVRWSNKRACVYGPGLARLLSQSPTLTDLDVTGCIGLESLELGQQGQLRSLAIGGCHLLQKLDSEAECLADVTAAGCSALLVSFLSRHPAGVEAAMRCCEVVEGC